MDTIRSNIAQIRREGALAVAWSTAWERQRGGGTLPTSIRTRIISTHYRPFVRGRLIVEAHLEGVAPRFRRRYLFVQVYPDREALARRLAAAGAGKRSLRAAGPAWFEVPEWNALAWELPNGPGLRRARKFMQNKAFRRFLRQHGRPEAEDRGLILPGLLRYVPRRRALFQWRTPQGTVSYIKLFAPGQDVEPARNLRIVADHRDQLRFDSPEIDLYDARCRVVFMREVQGQPLTSLLDEHEPERMEVLGQALASLHASNVTTRRSLTHGMVMARLRSAVAGMIAARPEATVLLKELLTELQGRADGFVENEDRPIHGNLFGDQVLVHEGSIGIVDWDDLSRGDPLYDLGRLVAHLVFERIVRGALVACTPASIGALLDAYERSAGPISIDRLNWQVSTALLMRAKISALRPLRPGWERALETTAAEAHAIIGRRSRLFPGQARGSAATPDAGHGGTGL